MNKTEVQSGCSLSLYDRHKNQKGRVLNSALVRVPTYQVYQYFLFWIRSFILRIDLPFTHIPFKESLLSKGDFP